MDAWLVVNGFIHTEKFRQIFDWLVQAAKKAGCRLEIKTNTQLLPFLAIDAPILWERAKRPDFVIFWDKDIRLARLLEQQGLKLFNCAQSIEICDDKARTFLELAGNGIAMPKTIIGPKTFHPQGYQELDFLPEIEKQLPYPMVVKECYGSFGQQVALVHNRQQLEEWLSTVQNRPCLFQEYISHSAGHDIRIQMTGQHVVAAMYRYNEHDFRANITNGGSMRAYTPSLEEEALAAKVMEILGLDFAGVDILCGENGQPVLCEVNSNAHFVNMYQCTGVNAAEHILRHCMETVENDRRRLLREDRKH